MNDDFHVTSRNFVVNEQVLSILHYPPKFIPTPSGCCHGQILEDIQDFLRKLKWSYVFHGRASQKPRFHFVSGAQPPIRAVPKHVLRKCDLIFKAVSNLLRNCDTCYSTSNISKVERLELQRLAADTTHVITPVDKGGKWMVLPRTDYSIEALRQLADKDFYQPLSEPKTKLLKSRLSNFSSFLYKTRFLSRREKRALQPPPDPRERRFYLLPKLHKAVWPSPCMPPGRPIISDTGSISREWASFVEYFLAPIAKRSDSYVRDSMHAISLIRDTPLPNPALFFTMDITSLYTNIPTEEGIMAVSRAFLKYKDPKRPDLSVLSVLRLLLYNNDFLFEGNRYIQVHGTAMGSAFGASYANIFLTEWEEKVTTYPLRPLLWLRYIDDIFGIWPYEEGHLSDFTNFVNSIHPRIKVTLTSSPVSVRFLDLEIFRRQSSIGYRVGFKPTDSFRILPITSFHPSNVFGSIIYSQIYRWCTRSSTYEDFKATKHCVQSYWRRQGYTRSKIRSAVKNVLFFTQQTPTNWDVGFSPCGSCAICALGFSTKSVSNSITSFPILHRLSCATDSIIYLIECKNCHVRYVGESSRALQMRISEHLTNIRTARPTAVSEHFRDECTPDDFSFTALEHCVSFKKRRKKEAAWIKRLGTLSPGGLNRVCSNPEPLRLVLPFSDCGSKVIRLCQSLLRPDDVTLQGSYRVGANLKSILNTNHRNPDPS